MPLKLMRRFRSQTTSDHCRDRRVFGVPLTLVQQRTGQPLPQCILAAMRCLRRTARDALGIFRKSGVKSRIQKLRSLVEEDPDSVDFESLHAYDVADLLKLYFRELPECIITDKLMDTFISIYNYVPEEQRREALQITILLLPDENRIVLQSLLLFLSDMATFSEHNQMTASNLAVCFAPSLFHLCRNTRSQISSPKRSRKQTSQGHIPGIPDQKDLQEQRSAQACLTQMIEDCKLLFIVPEDLLKSCEGRTTFMEQGNAVTLDKLISCGSSLDSKNEHTAYIDTCIQGILKESSDKFKGWINYRGHSSIEDMDISYKKVGDGHPLRLWKSVCEVEAPPNELLNRILRERHLWDEDFSQWRIIETLDERTELFEYITNNMAPHPVSEFCELRSWRTDLARGSCALVVTSIDHPTSQSFEQGIKAVILASRYLIEPCSRGRSRLTHISRIDIRGHSPEWYNRCFGDMCANTLLRIRESFKISTPGPETKC